MRQRAFKSEPSSVNFCRKKKTVAGHESWHPLEGSAIWCYPTCYIAFQEGRVSRADLLDLLPGQEGLERNNCVRLSRNLSKEELSGTCDNIWSSSVKFLF